MLVGFILTGCGSVPKEIVVERVVERKVEIPNSLLTCSAEPVAGSTWIRERDVAQYLVKLAAAGEDCRTKLAAVRRLVSPYSCDSATESVDIQLSARNCRGKVTALKKSLGDH